MIALKQNTDAFELFQHRSFSTNALPSYMVFTEVFHQEHLGSWNCKIHTILYLNTHLSKYETYFEILYKWFQIVYPFLTSMFNTFSFTKTTLLCRAIYSDLEFRIPFLSIVFLEH